LNPFAFQKAIAPRREQSTKIRSNAAREGSETHAALRESVPKSGGSATLPNDAHLSPDGHTLECKVPIEKRSNEQEKRAKIQYAIAMATESLNIARTTSDVDQFHRGRNSENAIFGPQCAQRPRRTTK